MATLFKYDYLITTIDGRPYEFGSLTSPVSIAIAGNAAHVWKGQVGTTTTKKVFDVTLDMADFDFILFASDFDLIVELVTDDGAQVGEEAYTIELLGSGTANKYGMPTCLASDDSYANYTVNFAGGTLDLIETVRFRNLSATQAAEAICLAFS